MRSMRPRHHRPRAINKAKAIVIRSTRQLPIPPNKREVEQTSRPHLSLSLCCSTDSSVDSSSDEHLQGPPDSTSVSHPQSTANAVTLQRKVSDRKAKRIRAKQNEATGSASSSELLRKSTIDELLRCCTRRDRSVFQLDRTMKLWPTMRNVFNNNNNCSSSSSNNRRRRNVDRVSNDERKLSTIKDRRIRESTPEWVRRIFSSFPSSFSLSHLDPKEASKSHELSSNVVASNEDDSSVGDYTKDSKVSGREPREQSSNAVV